MTADWCVGAGDLVICGTAMKEFSCTSEGIKWCFACRKRVEFHRIVMVPDGISYYGPSIDIRCSACGQIDGDLFPGRAREWEEAYDDSPSQ
jgi:hypothetical protein